MYKVIAIAGVGTFSGCEVEMEEWEFETLEEAQEFVSTFDTDDLWQMAIEALAPESYLSIFGEDDEKVE